MALAGIAAAVAAGVAWLSLGSGEVKPHYHLGGVGRVTVLVLRAPHRAPRHRGQPFKPEPAAVALSASLPLARQVAQLFMVGSAGAPSGGTRAAEPGWGGVVLSAADFRSDAQIASLAAGISASSHGAGAVPALIGATQEGGQDSAAPDLPPQSEAAIGASGRPALARAQARLAGMHLRGLGISMTLAPLADVDTPGGALSGRLFSTEPRAVARFSLAALEGYSAAGTISAVGHFPGSGGASADPDQTTATVGGSLAELRSRDLVPFAALAPAAPVIVMSNALYAAFDGVTPAALLAPAVRLLRRDYGFQGVVMSDNLDASLAATGEDPGSAALAALRAGDDLLYISGSASEQRAAYAAVLAAANRSAALRARVHEALLRVLSLKARYGLLRQRVR